MQQMDTSPGALTRLVWPIFVENILRTLMGNVIIMLLGRLSDSVVASVGTANQLFNMINLIYSMFAAAAGIVLNQQLGAGRNKDASDVMVIATGISLVFSAVCSAILFFFAPVLLRLIVEDPTLVEDGAAYLRIIGGLSSLHALNYLAIAICRSYGFTRYPMYVSLAMNLIHLGGAFVVVLRPFETPFQGATGIAWAAVFSVFCSLFPLIWILVRKIGYRIYIRQIQVSIREVVSAILKVAVPSGAEALSYNIGQIVVTSFLAPLGTAALTTRVIAQTLTAFYFMGSYSVGQGGQIVVGHLAGAGRLAEARTFTLRNWRIGLGLNLGFAAVGLLLARPLFGLYTQDPEIIRLGFTILLIDLVVEAARAGNMVIGYAMRGVGDAMYTMKISLPMVWIFNIGLGWLLSRGLHLGLAGAWIAIATDETLRSTLVYFRWKSTKWEKKRLVKDIAATSEEPVPSLSRND